MNSTEKSSAIYVTQPTLPPLEEFLPSLEKIWANKILTNGGPFHNQLETALCEYLGVEHVSLFTNGTVALITALQALEIKGEVITTPYSFVATAHSLLWNGIEPVFVDIDPLTLNLNPDLIDAAITDRTSAIMPVHCYGNPCDVDKIQAIADKHQLKVIYDAAHAFGVKCHCGSLLNHGDLSVLSLHATKVFNTFEGGAIVSRDAKMKAHIDNLKNFGFVDETTVIAAGINGKMSEICAAMGLLQLKRIEENLQLRRKIDNQYRAALGEIKGIDCLPTAGETSANYGYFPVLVRSEYPLNREELFLKLREKQIFARRYFYPLISEFPMYRRLRSAARESLPVAFEAASQVICLPIYPSMRDVDVQRVVEVIQQNASGR